MSETGKLEPRRLGSPPRNYRFATGATVVRALVWLAAVGLPVGLVIASVVESRQLTRFRDVGKVANGRITDKRVRSGRSKSYYLNFEYVVGSEHLPGRATVSRGTYRRTRVGDAARITYLPEEPTRYRFGLVTDTRITRNRNALLLGAVAALLCFGIVGLVIEITYGRSRRLLRDGRSVVATIEELTPIGSKKRGGAKISYSFRHPSGKTVKGSARVMRGVPAAWTVGTEVTVVYDKEKPARSALPESLANVVRLA